jgi:hypothetical protein
LWRGSIGGRKKTVHAAVVEAAGLRRICRLVAAGGEAILGRDLLSLLVAVLDGPRRTLTVRRPRKTPRRNKPRTPVV